MPRKDYEKFLIISKNFQDDYKTLIPAETDNFHLVFAKLVNKNYYNNKKTLKGKYGIRMDIFPLDGLGNTEMESIKQAKRIMFYRKFYSICFKDNILSKLLYKINFHKLAYKLLSKVFNKYTFEDSKYVGSVIGGLRELKEIFEYRVYSETMDMEFEGKTFKGMKYYDEYLTRMYGDYMKLPPKEKQVAEHNVEIYDMRGE